MTPRTPIRRLLAGKLLIVTGLGLLAGWAHYFARLVRPIDLWDFSPLPVAVAVIVVGVKLARYGERQLSQIPTLFSKTTVLAVKEAPKRALKIVQANAGVYVALLCLFCSVTAYQLRISLDTVHFERTLDFYVPFLLDPFTDRIGARDYFHSREEGSLFPADHYSGLRWRDELLSVNGRAFRGMSGYLIELRHTTDFTVTIRSSDSRIHHVEFGIPHCTCGRPSLFEAAIIWIAPPMFCVLLGFVTVCLRPRAMLAWAFLGIMLSLSQLQFWPDWYTGFQQTATPMAWMDWFRVPAVGYRSFVQRAWPAALLVASAHFYRSRRNVYRLALSVAALFVVFALLEAMLQIAWSEDFRKLVSLYRFMEQYGTELMTGSLAGVAGVAWLLNRRLGVSAMAIGLLTTVALYWSPASITEGTWFTYSDNSRFVATIPVPHNTPGFLALLFAAGCLVTSLIIVRREVTVREVASLVLCLPFVVDVAARFGAYLVPLGPGLFEDWPWFVMTSAGLGLAGMAWSVLRRTAIDSTSPATG
jgi:hypothetical protein